MVALPWLREPFIKGVREHRLRVGLLVIKATGSIRSEHSPDVRGNSIAEAIGGACPSERRPGAGECGVPAPVHCGMALRQETERPGEGQGERQVVKNSLDFGVRS